MHQLQYMKIKYIKLLKVLGIVTKLSVHFKRCQLLKDFKGCCRLEILLFGICLFFFGSFFSGCAYFLDPIETKHLSSLASSKSLFKIDAMVHT